MSKPAIHTARTFHEDALLLLTEAWHQAKDKAELWTGEEVRLRLEIEREIAKGDPHFYDACTGNICVDCCLCQKCGRKVGTPHIEACACPEGTPHWRCTNCAARYVAQ
jgi:hypothetical protein